jgi:hypothetical protein
MIGTRAIVCQSPVRACLAAAVLPKTQSRRHRRLGKRIRRRYAHVGVGPRAHRKCTQFHGCDDALGGRAPNADQVSEIAYFALWHRVCLSFWAIAAGTKPSCSPFWTSS